MTMNNMAHDPLEFVRNMWSRMGFTLPGMVTPTLDVNELDKRITDMRAVEGWLKMNLSMLQMAIQGLDMQRAAIAAVHAMSQPIQQPERPVQPVQEVVQEVSDDQEEEPAAAEETTAIRGNPFLWPWNMMSKPEAKTPTEAAPADDAPAAARGAKPRAKRKASAGDEK